MSIKISKELKQNALKFLNINLDMRNKKIKDFIINNDGLNKIKQELDNLKKDCNICFEQTENSFKCYKCTFSVCKCCYNKIIKFDNNIIKYFCPACKDQVNNDYNRISKKSLIEYININNNFEEKIKDLEYDLSVSNNVILDLIEQNKQLKIDLEKKINYINLTRKRH